MLKKERYFIFSATFGINERQIASNNFGCSRSDFPTIKDLKDVVMKLNENAHDILILSVCEVNKKDFKKFFSEQ